MLTGEGISLGCGDLKRRVFCLCEFNDAVQWYVPLVDSAAVLNDDVDGSDVCYEECPCEGGGVCNVLNIQRPNVISIIPTIGPPVGLENEEDRI